MRKSTLFVSLVAALALGFALRPLFESRDTVPDSAPAPQVQRAPVNAPPAPAMNLPDFAGLVEQAGPAVVNITTVARSRGGQGMPGIDPDSPFAPFFRQFTIPQQPREMVGQGSGFIVRKDGIILTNTHVVAGATEVKVRLSDRREFTAKVLGSDTRTDVAVLKIEADDLPVATLGSSENVRVGQWVVAIGAPFGFENSVTSGIVSAKSRSMPGNSDSAVPFIQTDVAVNPGNSGGPLFDLNGHVVGINSQIYSRSGGYQGISFAIPIETALNVQEQILTTGKVRHGRLGVGVQPVSQQLADSFDLESLDGALVGQVEKGSAGERAGLKEGDVIVAVDGAPIADPARLVQVISAKVPGTRVELTVIRDGRERKVGAVLGGEETSVAASDTREPGAPESGKLGLAVRPLTPQERRQAGVDGGLLVEESTGAAAEAGIQPGDLIIAVNRKPVSTVQELREATDAVGKRGTLALLIQRDTSRIYIPVTVG